MPVPSQRQTASRHTASFPLTAALPGTGPYSHFSDNETDVQRDSVSLPTVSVQVAELGLRPGSPRLAPDRATVTRMTRSAPPVPWAWRIGGQVEAQPAEDGGRPRASPELLAKEVLPRQVRAQPARGQGGGPCGQAQDKVTLGQGWAHGASSRPPGL